jgi:hypothetical protein
MIGQVAQLFPFRPRSKDWSNQELAEFYRVEASLVQAGLKIDTDRGLSDENEPWFVFCHAETGEIIIHFARIDGVYVAASGAFAGALRGTDFRSLVEALLARHPLVVPQSGTKISLHPSALLVALVATAFFKLSELDAHASELGTGHDDGQALDVYLAGRTIWPGPLDEATHGAFFADRRQATILLAAISFAVAQHELDLSNVKPNWTIDNGGLYDDAERQSSEQLASDLLPSMPTAGSVPSFGENADNHPALPLDGGYYIPHTQIFQETLPLLSLHSGATSDRALEGKAALHIVEVTPKGAPDKVVHVEDLSIYEPPHDREGGSSSASAATSELAAPNSSSGATSSEFRSVGEMSHAPQDNASSVAAALQGADQTASVLDDDKVSFVETAPSGSADVNKVGPIDGGTLSAPVDKPDRPPATAVNSGPVDKADASTPATPKVESAGAGTGAPVSEGSNAHVQADGPMDKGSDGSAETLTTFNATSPDHHVVFSGDDAVVYSASAETSDAAPPTPATVSYDTGSSVGLVGVQPDEGTVKDTGLG